MQNLIITILTAISQPVVQADVPRSASFTVSNPEAKAKEEALWLEGKELLEPAGITRQMFGVLNLWLEGQFHLGNCNRYLKANDVAFYRTWWEDTILPTTDVGRYFLKMGTEMYNDGLKEGRRNRPSLELCQRTADSWMADMRVQNAAK